jgi:hypothetical protein
METMTDFWPLGQPAIHNRDAEWATAYNVIAADDDLGLDVAVTAHFAEMLASLWWAANGDDRYHFITFGPWTVTAETECDWVGMGVDAPIVEILYEGIRLGVTDEGPKHVATVAIDNVGD